MPATVASLYEQLFPLTTVMKQRFVENFSGDSLDTNRWFFQSIAAGASAVIADTVDGGLQMTTTDGASPSGYLGFDNKCQYNPAGFRFISTCKKNMDLMGIRGGIGSAIPLQLFLTWL